MLSSVYVSVLQIERIGYISYDRRYIFIDIDIDDIEIDIDIY